MVKEPVEGQLYWCILPPDESQACGDDRPRKPWQGKLERTSNGALRLCHHNAESGQIDDDSNACAHVRDSSLHDTKLEALEAYSQALSNHIHDLREQLSDAVEELDQCERDMDEEANPDQYEDDEDES